MKVFLGLATLLAAGTLGAAVASRMPAETVAMGLGLILGALASIPLSAALSAVTRQGGRPVAAPVDAPAVPVATQPPYPRVDTMPLQPDCPPLVLVNPAAWSAAAQPAYASARPHAVAEPVGQRQFRIVGETA